MSHDRTTPADLLPEELLWAAGGHASDIVLTALADGQRAIVPASARTHVERCPTCTLHLGHAALLSLHTGAELAVRLDHDRVLARRPLPRLAIALGLVVAGLGLVPSLLDDEMETARLFVHRDLPLFLKGIGVLAHRLDEPGSPADLLVTYGTAATLVVMAIALLRILPKKETPR